MACSVTAPEPPTMTIAVVECIPRTSLTGGRCPKYDAPGFRINSPRSTLIEEPCPSSVRSEDSLREARHRNAGQVVGRFFGASGGIHGFINTGGTFTTLDVPGAGFTEAFGINNAGQVVGLFADSSGVHGFVASPVPLPAAVWLLGTTLVGGLGFVRRRLV